MLDVHSSGPSEEGIVGSRRSLLGCAEGLQGRSGRAGTAGRHLLQGDSTRCSEKTKVLGITGYSGTEKP